MTSDDANRRAFLRAEAYYLEPPEEREDEDDDYDEDDAREDAELARAEYAKENRGWD